MSQQRRNPKPRARSAEGAAAPEMTPTEPALVTPGDTGADEHGYIVIGVVACALGFVTFLTIMFVMSAS